MKTSYIVLIVVGLFILILGGCSITNYNGMNTAQKDVELKWKEVQSSYQERFDLIPNLVATVKGAADFEQTTLTQVIEARASASKIEVNAKDLTPEKLQQFQQSQGQLSQALGKLMVVSEQYPQLKATEAFKDLSVVLERTENKIKRARNEYNRVVRDYDVKVSNFPGNIFASIFHFKEIQGFQSEAGAEKAQKVDFSKPKQ